MTIIALVIVGLGAGFIAAALGLGGGIVFVPALGILLGFEQHIAQGTSLAVILPTAVVATIAHARRARVAWPTALKVAGGGVGGALLGAFVALALDPSTLRRVFAVFLVAVALRLLSGAGSLPTDRDTDGPG